jgi:hypothetical protein
LYEQGFTISGARNRLDGARATSITVETGIAEVASPLVSVAGFDLPALKLGLRDIITMLNA